MNRVPTLEITEGVARLTLNRPPLNILTLAMIRQLAEGLDTVAQQTRLKAMVLAATGKAFCAGVDVADHTPERTEPMIREFCALSLACEPCPCRPSLSCRGQRLAEAPS